MNNKDLEYIFNNSPYTSKNIYKTGVKASTNGLYIDYLESKNINYKIEETDSNIKIIKILTKDNNLIATINNPLYPNNNTFGISIMNNKLKTEKYLKEFGISTPDSKIYKYSEVKRAKADFFKENPGKNAVIKPLNGSLSRGVYVNVSEHRFETNWNYSLNDRKNNLNAQAIVQKYMDGFEVRATILQGQLISIVSRIPSYVIGDGKSNIADLVKSKNRERRKCSYLRKHPINITNKHTEFLISHKLSIDSKLDKNRKVLLGSISNIINGGEIINITDLVSNHIKEFALDTLAAFPGMYSGGLDIMIKSFDDPDPHVLEVNNFPVISLTKYPTYGIPAKPEKILIDSIIAQYQFLNDDNTYKIENQESHIKEFINFSRRQVKMNNIRK